MDEQRLMWHLENWVEWMTNNASGHRLGYPTHSLMIASGGSANSEAFELMCDESDITCAKAIDGIIDSITLPQRTAINHAWLKVKHHYPTHELDLLEAYENIIRLCNKRGLI